MDKVVMSRKKDKSLRSGLELKKLYYDKNSQDVILYSKMPIISSKNTPTIKVNDKKIMLDIYNNETFTIKKILDNDNIIIKNDKIELEVPSDNFQRKMDT